MWILERDLSVSELKNFALYFKLSPAKQWDHNLRQSSSFCFRAGGWLEVVKWAHRGLGHHHAVPLASVVMFLFPLGSGCWFLGAASANFSHLTSETLLIWLFVGCLHDLLGPWGIWGGFWGLEVFMPHLGSQETTRCPFTINTPHHSGTFVPINEPTLTYHYQPKSIVSIRVQSWCKQSMGLDVVSCPFQ